jgi:hypothetical protein
VVLGQDHVAPAPILLTDSFRPRDRLEHHP